MDDREQATEAVEPRACAGVLNLAGEHFPCDWPTDDDGTHEGWAHANKQARALWADSPDVRRPEGPWPTT